MRDLKRNPEKALDTDILHKRYSQDLRILVNHHTKPKYEKVSAILEKSQMSWNPRKANSQWNYWPKQKAPKNKAGDPKAKKQGFPGYDAQYSSLPSSSSTGSAGEESTAKQILQALLKSNNLQVPDEIKGLIDEPLEGVREQQRHLNVKRKAIQKLDKLRQAKIAKGKKWDSFKAELAKHLRQEQEKFERDIQDLDVAIVEAQKEVDRIEQGLPPEDEKEDDLEELLAEDSSSDAKQMLKEAQEINKRDQEQIQRLKAQLQAYTQSAAHPTGPAPDTGMEPNQSPQHVRPPKTKEQLAKEKAERRARIDKVETMQAQLGLDRERSPR